MTSSPCNQKQSKFKTKQKNLIHQQDKTASGLEGLAETAKQQETGAATEGSKKKNEVLYNTLNDIYQN